MQNIIVRANLKKKKNGLLYNKLSLGSDTMNFGSVWLLYMIFFFFNLLYDMWRCEKNRPKSMYVLYRNAILTKHIVNVSGLKIIFLLFSTIVEWIVWDLELIFALKTGFFWLAF